MQQVNISTRIGYINPLKEITTKSGNKSLALSISGYLVGKGADGAVKDFPRQFNFFGKTAEYVYKNYKVGDVIVVTGEYKIEEYIKDNETKERSSITVKEVLMYKFKYLTKEEKEAEITQENNLTPPTEN